MSTWNCPKCSARNGKFDKKCFNCGKKRPPEFAPSADEEAQNRADEDAGRKKEKERFDEIGNRMPLALIGAFVTSVIAGCLWYYGNTLPSGPINLVSVLISLLYGSAIGSVVWFLGKGFSRLYGFIAGTFALVSAVVSQALIYTYYLALHQETDPQSYLGSFDPILYTQGFLFGFSGIDLIFYILIFVGAYWFSWRNNPEENRLSLFTEN